MILAALLLLQTAPSDDIVVTAGRLERFKASLTANGCKVRTSTGDAALDRIGCEAMQTCFPQYQSRYQATGERRLKASTRKVMRAALNGELTNCVDGEHRRGIAALAAARKATNG
ncbi:hypothetical protein SAMN06297144_1260 [Sphingomonas guangdongensis]|uniref:Uncharacterized protein n=1 Tax=Sphingomonas guangdongensis TaxID=1141890 RepID=A0A285QH85_9SPHN|nr:hypothetical protein [Sphingomonas guangdongensis]SOB80834.1 hypothetical protein SAMN06297144_1260 [Sphingomonas guangdongensis]